MQAAHPPPVGSAGPETAASPGDGRGGEGAGDVGSLLTDMLQLVRELMTSDTATVLLLDVSGTVLHCVAALGNPDAARQRFRVPVGRGFAGGIAASKRPAAVREVNEHTVVNPHITRSDVSSLLGVPLIQDGELLGVLHIGTVTACAFTDEQIATLSRAAHSVAHAVKTQSSSAENALASALQRTLNPASPPTVSGMDLAARYVPADGHVGGDWHDVFLLPGGRLGLVIGDVVGHGFESAVVMGRLRSSLRCYALEHLDPDEVLRRLDAKIHYFESGALATVLYGVTEPPFTELVFSSAGHLSPLLAQAGQPAHQVDVEADPPLGVDPSLPRTRHVVRLPPGSSLCLFTDGLVERRPGADAVTGDQVEDGLRRVVRAFTAGPADTTCAQVLKAGLADMPGVRDDITVLVARPTGTLPSA